MTHPSLDNLDVRRAASTSVLPRPEPLGLAHRPEIGWSVATVPEATQRLYRDELDELAFALVAYRRCEPGPRDGRESGNNGVAACDCGRKMGTTHMSVRDPCVLSAEEAGVCCGQRQCGRCVGGIVVHRLTGDQHA